MIQTRALFVGFLFFLSFSAAQAGVRLPIHSLRDQASTDHCWAYSMSHLLETRALTRSATDVVIRVEKDVKYWVDYERMFYIYKTKKDFYLDFNYEGAWQIEFWETLLKHGKHITASKAGTPDVWYDALKPFNQHLPFVNESRPNPDPTLINATQLANRLRAGFTSDSAADLYIRDYLDRQYGRPEPMTQWMGSPIAVRDTAAVLLGDDLATNPVTESVVLIKPVTDGNLGWVQYLGDRYWGYRYEANRVLELIRTSLDHRWPVTFDNVSHAMTIVGYETDAQGIFFFAVADSVPGKITWYSADQLMPQLNLVTVFRDAVPGALPPRTPRTMAQVPMGLNIDQHDRVDVPPR